MVLRYLCGRVVTVLISHRCQIESVTILLQFGAPLQAHDATGRTPLHVAAAAGHSTAVGVLLDRGASVSALSKTGMMEWRG
jgi:ankyrin repeat protein